MSSAEPPPHEPADLHTLTSGLLEEEKEEFRADVHPNHAVTIHTHHIRSFI